jgi:hypothetical protein
VICRSFQPNAPMITTPARNEVASTAMRLLAEASTTLAGIKAGKRL